MKGSESERIEEIGMDEIFGLKKQIGEAFAFKE